MHRSLFFATLLTVTLSILGACTSTKEPPTQVVKAGPTVTIKYPTLVVFLDGQENTLNLWAEATPTNISYKWKLMGSGKLTGPIDTPSVQYVTPRFLDGEEQEVYITVTVTNPETGQQSRDRITIRLLSPTPTATPTFTPTPTPTPTFTPTPTYTYTPTPTPTYTPTPTHTFTPTSTNTPTRPVPTNTATPTPLSSHWLGDYVRSAQARVSSQRFAGGWMLGQEGVTTALFGRDSGTRFAAYIEFNEESDPEYPDVEGCPIKQEGKLGPRYGFGKFWCMYPQVRSHLVAPKDVGQAESIEVAEFSNGYALFIPQYGRAGFEIHNDGRWRRAE